MRHLGENLEIVPSLEIVQSLHKFKHVRHLSKNTSEVQQGTYELYERPSLEVDRANILKKKLGAQEVK